jgi:release factor glutamine methyltransferase
MPQTVTVQTLLSDALKRLMPISSTPQLDASLLLSHALGISRAKLFALPPNRTLTKREHQCFRKLLKKRLKGYPIAYLTGSREFYGRSFVVKKGVLIPRPDSEVLIEELLKLYKTYTISSLRDIGTGSGALALTLYCETQGKIDITASDISRRARHVFKINNRRLTGGKVAFKKASLLDDGGHYTAIVANLPYLTSREVRERRHWKEPLLALDGGKDGLGLIRKLTEQAGDKTEMLMLEADPRQMPAIEKLLQANGFCQIRTVPDLSGEPRIIIGFSQLAKTLPLL